MGGGVGVGEGLGVTDGIAEAGAVMGVGKPPGVALPVGDGDGGGLVKTGAGGGGVTCARVPAKDADKQATAKAAPQSEARVT